MTRKESKANVRACTSRRMSRLSRHEAKAVQMEDDYNRVALWLKNQQKVGVASIQRQFCLSYNKSVRMFKRLVKEGLLLPGITKSVWVVRKSDDPCS